MSTVRVNDFGKQRNVCSRYPEPLDASRDGHDDGWFVFICISVLRDAFLAHENHLRWQNQLRTSRSFSCSGAWTSNWRSVPQGTGLSHLPWCELRGVRNDNYSDKRAMATSPDDTAYLSNPLANRFSCDARRSSQYSKYSGVVST